jgi:hypothetical protein
MPVKEQIVISLVVLMMEEEQPEGLSARKLVVETAKHNVLTEYNAEDGIQLLRRFPKVDIVLVHFNLLARAPGILSEVKELAPGIPIILTSPGGYLTRPEADFVIDSHQPQALIELLATKFNANTEN